jgi:alkylation response protein AidB-like acyl-CoA dehydrogenase
MPVADVTIVDAVCIAQDASAAWHAALDEYAVLTAAAAVGMAARALEMTVDYAGHRQAWGQPIGAFQGVAHRLADCATAVDGARLLTWEAAWAEAEDPERFSELAAMAFGFASEAARDTTYWGVHLHGGYGFMLEYDVQLFWRRCRAWTRLLGSPADAYRLVADRRYAT